MKNIYILLPAALLAGLVLGGWGPRSELHELRKELASTRELLKSKKGRGSSDVKQVTEMLGISSKSERKISPADRSAGNSPEPGTETGASGSENTNSNEVVEQETESASPEKDEQRKESMAEQIEEAVEVWKLRSDIARSTFIENGNLATEDAQDFDVLMEAMNIRLEHAVSQWAETLKEKEEPEVEDGVRLINSVTDVLVLTYDEMDDKLPENWRKTAGEGLELTDFIDPSVAKPLIPVEDKLDRPPQSFRRDGR